VKKIVFSFDIRFRRRTWDMAPSALTVPAVGLETGTQSSERSELLWFFYSLLLHCPLLAISR